MIVAAAVEKKGEASVEREKCGGEDGCPSGGDSGGGGFGWWLERRRERGREKKLQKRGREAGFWPTLDPIFSSLR